MTLLSTAVGAIDAEGKRRGLTLSRAANDAIRCVLLDDTGDKHAHAPRA